MSKKLTAYFSATGTTKMQAENIAKIEDTDIIEITPSKEYTAADLDWQNPASRSSVEQKDETARPAISNDEDISEYDVIYLGFPIWWYTYPRIIDTFIEKFDLSGKKIIPFATSGSTNITKAAADLREALKGVAEVEDGHLLKGVQTPEAIKIWADKF